MKKNQKNLLSVLLSLFIGMSGMIQVYAGHYYDDQYRDQYRYQGGFPGRGGQGGGYDSDGGSAYSDSSCSYYACPNGDFISDRPGQCPLDGQWLVERRSSGHQRNPYQNPYG
ncbi:MAG: hypothetical protein HYS08_10465 [Chlamydiae bacterium]|nr:hypothetical protein [Chlamydiota bacterium]MBI3266549.1 hypothetical protein [Chlamydiota bacterium]